MQTVQIQGESFNLVAAPCAVGINSTGAGFRMVHSTSGRQIGIVARTPELVWGYIPAGTEGIQEAEWATAAGAAMALSDRIAGEKASLAQWFAEGTRVRLSAQHITFKAGWGTVRYVDGNYIGVEFDDGDKRAVRSAWLVKDVEGIAPAVVVS